MLIYLSDKMSTKKLKLKNEKNWTWQNLKTVFKFNFFGEHFVMKTSFLFEISIKFWTF
jgi:hypothetical protein